MGIQSPHWIHSQYFWPIAALNGGFLWGYPNSWLVYFTENPM
jgi:hypothetical protein